VEETLFQHPRSALSLLLALLACQPQRGSDAPAVVQAEPATPPPAQVEAEPGPADPLAAVQAIGQRPRLVRSWAAGSVSALAIGRQGGAALVGSADGEVTRWMLPEALLEQRWDGPPDGGEGPVVAVGHWFSHVWAIWDIDGELLLVDLIDDRVGARMPTPAAGIADVVFPRDQEHLLVALGDGSFARWTPPASALEPLDAAPVALDPVAEAARWAGAGLTDDVQLDARSGEASVGVTRSAGPARLSEDGRVLLGVHHDRLALWHLDAPRAIDEWGGEGPITNIRYAADGLLLLVERGDGVAEVRDAASGRLLVSSPNGEAWEPVQPGGEALALSSLPGVVAAARSPDGRWLVSGVADGGLRRWDLDALRQGRILDTRLDRMLRADPLSSDALLARADLAAIGGRWGREADLLDLSERQGAAVHPARHIRALALAGRLGGAREQLARVAPGLRQDPAVRAWAAWLDAQPGG